MQIDDKYKLASATVQCMYLKYIGVIHQKLTLWSRRKIFKKAPNKTFSRIYGALWGVDSTDDLRPVKKRKLKKLKNS